jgi:uncharacterized membrane protein YfhO
MAKKKHKNQTQTVLSTPAVSDNKYLALSFIFPVAILGTVFALNGVYPFGNRQILVGDLYHSYYPFISGFWHKLREGGAVSPWSWTAGMGHDYIGLIALCLASPLYLLTIIVPHDLLREAVTVILLIKIGSAGLFTALYLRYAYKQCYTPVGKRDATYSLALPVFSSLYALCAFTLGYYLNIVWFDSFAMLPLVMLGLLALMREGKFKLYIVSLALAVLMNFYIGYIICVFVVITFVGQCVVQKLNLLNFLRKLRLIAACSVLVAALTAVSTIPAWFALQNVYSVRASSPTMTLYTSFFDILGNFIAFTPPTILNGLPNLYSGLISVMLAGLFMQSNKILLREKIVSIIIFVFLLISTNIDILNIIMHGFTRPMGYPARYSFLISFVLVVMAYRAFLLTEDMGKSGLLAIGISASLVLLSAVIGPQKTNYIVGSAVLGAFYILLFYLSLTARTVKTSTFAKAALFITVLTELSITSYIGIKTVRTTDRDEYYYGYEQIKALLNTRKKTDVDFYRTDLDFVYNNNQPYLYNYNGVCIFLSSVNPDLLRLMQGLGLNSSRSQFNTNSFYYSATSPLTNAFLNMRYLISPTGNIADKNFNWEIVGKIGDSLLLENKYYLPLGFMVDNKLTDYKYNDNPFLAQNIFFQLATGLDGDLFEMHEFNISDPKKNDYKQQILKFNYQFSFTGMAYAYCRYDDIVFRNRSRSYLLEIDLNKTETRLTSFKFNIGDNTPYIFPLGEITQSDNITFSIEINNNDNKALICVGLLNGELFERGYAKLSSQVLQLTEFTNIKVKGKITALDDGLLYTSIPADKNWSAYVDGVKREIVKIDNAMIAVSLNKGYHEIEFRYFNTGLLAGGIVSIVSLAVFIVLAVMEMRKRRSSEI